MRKLVFLILIYGKFLGALFWKEKLITISGAATILKISEQLYMSKSVNLHDFCLKILEKFSWMGAQQPFCKKDYSND